MATRARSSMPSRGSASFGSSPAMPRSGSGFGRPPSTQVRDLGGRFVKGGLGWEWHGLPALMAMPDDAEDALLDGAENAVKKMAEDMEQYMRDNAPWEDRTGDARDGLRAVAVVDRSGGRFVIYCGYSVDYGVYLETMNGGEFAIVGPTIEEFGTQLGDYMAEAVSGG